MMTKNKHISNFIYFTMGFIITLLAGYLVYENYGSQAINVDYNMTSYPSEKVLISSLGQSTDVYIVQNVIDKRRISSQFMPQAEPTELEDISSAVLVVGSSELGMRLVGKEFDSEIARINELVDYLKAHNIPLIMVYIGQDLRLNGNTWQMLDQVGSQSDLVISNSRRASDYLRTYQAAEIVTIEHLSELNVVFSSAFR